MARGRYLPRFPLEIYLSCNGNRALLGLIGQAPSSHLLRSTSSPTLTGRDVSNACTVMNLRPLSGSFLTHFFCIKTEFGKKTNMWILGVHPTMTPASKKDWFSCIGVCPTLHQQ